MTIEDFKIKVLPIRNKLFRFAKRLLKETADAEDVTQEVLIKLWSNKEKLNQYNSIEAFAMIITKNMCLDELKVKRREVVELNSTVILPVDSTPYKQTELADSMKTMNLIIDTLPEQQKMIIQLRDIEGYSFDEIAEIMDLGINVIRVNLSRARKKVRDEFKNLTS
ncbi:MAG: sigma-70 family RNA polymerase sigma factor [Bacteroidota bacterium]